LHAIASTVPTPFRAAGANICDTDSCQVYRGMAREREPGAEGWNAAVAATANQVVLYNGQPIFAEYSSSNGGRSVAGSEPYLRSVADPDDAASPLHHWNYSAPVSAFAGALGVAPPASVTAVARRGDTVVYAVQAPPPPTPTTTTTTTRPGEPPQPPPPPPAPPPPVGQSMAVGDFVAK